MASERGVTKVLDQAHGDRWTSWHGDVVEVIRGVPDNSVGISIYSPPFSSLYTYSDSERDMGNCESDAQFFEQYSFLLPELLRVTMPGRLTWVHCKDLVDYASSEEHGRAGLRDFPGEIIRAHEACGWKYHARFTVWKDPVVEMQRTKAHGLLYKQLRTDSTFSRSGLAEYVLVFRKWASEQEAELVRPVGHMPEDFPLEQWQRWASPVWMDIDQTDVLNTEIAREDRDEKHMCPLQLDLVERCLVLGSNPGDTCFTPFSGIASEGVVSTRLGRPWVGVELKNTYWKRGVRNLRDANAQRSLFELLRPLAPTETHAP